MTSPRITSPIAQAILALLCSMWLMAGSHTLLSGTFSTSSKRGTHTPTVAGLGAEFMGLVFIALGLLDVLLLVQHLAVRPSLRVLVALVLALVPPLAVRAWMAA